MNMVLRFLSKPTLGCCAACGTRTNFALGKQNNCGNCGLGSLAGPPLRREICLPEWVALLMP